MEEIKIGKLENINNGEKQLYSTGYFSGNYSQDLYLKKSVDDGSNKPKYYISAYSNINGMLLQQGYLYFYLDYDKKTSSFIGLKVEDEYRNLNIGSFLVACWIDLCLNNGYNFLGTYEKQKKPFLIYLLKTYGFEILDKSLYQTRPDVISILRDIDTNNKKKYILFKDENHERRFIETNIYKTDDYKIVHDTYNKILLDNIILPLQSIKKNKIRYELINQELAQAKSEIVISRHKK